MTENKTSALYLILLLGSGVIIGVSLFQGELLGNYGRSTESMTYLNVSTEVAGELKNIKSSLETTSITGNAFLDALVAGTYKATTLFYGIGNIFTTFITNLAVMLGAPEWAVIIAIAAVLSVIIFSIIEIISNREGI